MSKRLAKRILSFVAILLGLWLILELVSRLFAEILWFQEVGYLSALIIRWQSQYGLLVLISSISILFLEGNLWLASRWRWRWLPQEQWFEPGISYLPHNKRRIIEKQLPGKRKANYQQFLPLSNAVKQTYSPRLKLPFLLILSIAIGVAIAGILLHYGNTLLSVWEYSYRLPQISSTLTPPWESLLSNLPEFMVRYVRQVGIVVVIVACLLWKPRLSSTAIALIISFIFGCIWMGNWTLVLKFFKPSYYGDLDPQFGRDIGFYLFHLPLWELLEYWLLGLCGYGLAACFLYYLLSGNSLSEGKFPGFSRPQLRHLSFLGATLMLALAFQHWLNRYDLLYSARGVVYGGGYTDINIQLLVETSLTVVSIVIAVWLFYEGCTGYGSLRNRKRKIARIIIFLLPFATYLLVVLLGNLWSVTVQRLVVQPNELEKERPYIERSIAMTRKAFNLDTIEAEIFNPQGQLTAQDLQQNDLTIKNIRLWDTRPILQTNRQLQQIRPYYRFPDADIDRYLLQTQIDRTSSKEKQQVIIAARELDYSEVLDIAKTWVNKHLVYTHGYGFTLSPVNQVDQGGLPFYFVKDIGTGSIEEGNLTVSSDIIRQSIPIGTPRIYYGELTETYIMTSTKVKELDFPSGEDNVYNTYDGTGGIKIKNYGRRILFAQYLKDWQMLFTQNFTKQTKLLFRRNIRQRVKAIAPFLSYDRDPYLVVAQSDTPNPENVNNNLYWIIDAYTISDRYPYSDPGKNRFNYLRNSVKVVVNAYNGNVDFYIAEPGDPLIQTWNKVFPKLFKPLSAMPASLRRHIRYPEDLFSTQSERLLTYHMTDPQVFYNREDQWQIPQEIYGKEAQKVKPYYLIMKLPTATAEEFILLHPYTPISRPNLIAWLAARSDGENYGKLLLYKFPKQRLIYGPNQIEALINQDPIISQQISLWNREGSRAIQGNLLIIPIEQSLLYVEPLYLEAERNSLPTLARVIVIYENQIVMAETLDAALNAIFAPGKSPDAIIRPIE